MWKLALFLAGLGFVFAAEANAGPRCIACVKEKVAGMREDTARNAILSALAGLKVNAFSGAVCGAVIGAVGTASAKLVAVAQCAETCKKEAAQEHDLNVMKCEDLLKK